MNNEDVRFLIPQICGCHEPELAWRAIQRVLTEASKETQSGTRSLIRDETEGEDQIIAGLLTYLDLIEHGSGINYSWLTEKGREVLKRLNDPEFFVELEQS